MDFIRGGLPCLVIVANYKMSPPKTVSKIFMYEKKNVCTRCLRLIDLHLGEVLNTTGTQKKKKKNKVYFPSILL